MQPLSLDGAKSFTWTALILGAQHPTASLVPSPSLVVIPGLGHPPLSTLGGLPLFLTSSQLTATATPKFVDQQSKRDKENAAPYWHGEGQLHEHFSSQCAAARPVRCPHVIVCMCGHSPLPNDACAHHHPQMLPPTMSNFATRYYPVRFAHRLYQEREAL